MTDFKEIEPLKVNGITVAEVSEGGTELLIIDRVWPEEALALYEWLTRALFGEYPMLEVRIHKGDDVIVDAKELVKRLPFMVRSKSQLSASPIAEEQQT